MQRYGTEVRNRNSNLQANVSQFQNVDHQSKEDNFFDEQHMYEKSEEEPQEGEMRLHRSPAVSAVLALSAGLNIYRGSGRGSF